MSNSMAAEWIGLVGAATSRHLVPANDCNVTVIIEDTSLLPGYGDKQVSLPTDESRCRSVVYLWPI